MINPLIHELRFHYVEGFLFAVMFQGQECSTIDIQTTKRVAEMIAAAGLCGLDAPVSGGVGGATAGTLTFMVGGGI